MRKPIIHDLKVNSKFWNNLSIQEKNFELRKLDRDYQVNDYVRLHFYSDELKEIIESEKPIIAKIQYILKDAEIFGLQKDYGVLALMYYQSFSLTQRIDYKKTESETI